MYSSPALTVIIQLNIIRGCNLCWSKVVFSGFISKAAFVLEAFWLILYVSRVGKRERDTCKLAHLHTKILRYRNTPSNTQGLTLLALYSKLYSSRVVIFFRLLFFRELIENWDNPGNLLLKLGQRPSAG